MVDEGYGDDPYGDPYGDAPPVDPYGDPAEGAYASGGGYAGDDDDAEVVGLLGGEQAPEELPALPGAAGDAAYSASDFIDSGEDNYADPYADPYADTGEAEDPYALPPSESHEDYEGYDAGAMADSDPSYFDSMGHDDGYGADIETQAADDYTDYDDGSPKTISQQDAESIIRRITTKRILPPDQDKTKSAAPRQLTPTGGGLRIWPILIAALLLGAGAVLTFKEEIAKAIPELAPLLGVTLEVEKPPEQIQVEDPVVKAKRLMLEKVLKSELKAFDVKASDLTPKAPSAPAGGGSPGGTGSPADPGAGTGS